ncbi:MAG TPA: heat-inducible transcriptional repressor HrcA [Fimbriimonadaceae bacterium]|nr:heat-inducible transcriptional repressor HrcA [Fimbriimonadaceae bacterium]
MAELDARKQAILQAVIFEYVSSADPVGSELLVQKYALGVKSATVRNELADLAEMGYLEQPHTSAGRIPSDLGYRYYVDRLIVNREPESLAKQKVRDASSDGDALQALLRDTARALSRFTQLLTAATTTRDQNVTVRNAIVSALGPSQALVVLVLSNGHVDNRMIECPVGLTLEDIGRANELLNSATAGKSLKTLGRQKAPSVAGNPAIDKLLSVIWSNLRNIVRDLTRGLLITEGEEYMFAQPEFQRDAAALALLLDELVESDVLYDTLVPSDTPQTVTIGKEHRHEEMHQLSVVRHSFFAGESEAGVIALIGPTRMRYDTSIPLVNFTARALSESLSRFFG